MKNNNINKLKALACYMVVLNHFHPGGVLGNITYAISHYGVPVFFVISGYFFFDKEENLPWKRLYSKVKHIALLLILHVVLYVSYEVIASLVSGETFAVAVNGLRAYFNSKTFIKALVFGTGIMGGGEWFLVSLLEAYVVIGILARNVKIKGLIVRYSHFIAILLFLVHIPIRMYVVKSGVESVGLIKLTESWCVRNTWLDAIPFLLLGISIRRNKNCKTSHPLFISIFAMVIAVGECFFSKEMLAPQSISTVLYIGIIVAVVSSFIWAVSCNCEDNILARIGDRYSMLIYFLHPIVGWVLKSIIKTSSALFEMGFYIIVVVATTFVSIIVFRCREVSKKGFEQWKRR